MDTQETVFSLEQEVPGSLGDLEGEDVGALQPGSLAHGSLLEICSLRKITPMGAVLRVDSPLRTGDRLDFALLTGERLSGTVDWAQRGEIGLRFDEIADVFGLIARNLVRQPGDARRMPRIELSCQAWLAAGGRKELVTTKNVSDGGACIETILPLATDDQVVLTLDGLRPVAGDVRWVSRNLAGIRFEPTVPWQELMPWLKQRQPGARQMPMPPTPAPLPQTGQPAADEGISLNLAARVREGTNRWIIEVETIDTRHVRFISYAALEPGRLFWISLPGLEGWPARITQIEGYSVTCAFTQPLHPAVLGRVLREAAARKQAG